jgi:hypothetical protein
MAMNTQAPKHTNWWVWVGAAGAAVFVFAALGYGLDWVGNGTVEGVAPGTEQTAPVSE